MLTRTLRAEGVSDDDEEAEGLYARLWDSVDGSIAKWFMAGLCIARGVKERGEDVETLKSDQTKRGGWVDHVNIRGDPHPFTAKGIARSTRRFSN